MNWIKENKKDEFKNVKISYSDFYNKMKKRGFEYSEKWIGNKLTDVEQYIVWEIIE